MRPVRSFLFFVLIVFSMPSWSQTTPEQMVFKMGRGINLGNVLSAPFEGDWALPVEETYFEDVSNSGFQNVRIPIRFDNQTTALEDVNYTAGNGSYIGSPSDYTVNASYLDRIEEVVGWALSNNLVAIIDVHGDHWFWESYDASSTEYKTGNDRLAAEDRFRAIWTAISTRFQNASEDVLFEIMNEAYFSMSASEVNFINSEILTIIRQTNPTRNVIVNGGGATSWEAPLQLPSTLIDNDDYLIATFHYYKPFNFTSSSRQEYDDFEWGTEADKAVLDTHFDTVLAWSQTNAIPVYLGEFGADNEGGYDYELQTYGAYGGPTKASRVAYHNYISKAATSRGFSFAVWDAGHRSNKTVYNASDRSWVVDVRNAVLDIDCLASQFIFNADIECGFDSEWSLFTQSPAMASYSNAEPEHSRGGSTTMKIDVSNSGTAFNNVILSNQVLDASVYVGETLRISCFAKASTPNQAFRIRVKAVVEGSDVFSPSGNLNMSNSLFENFEYLYDVPQNAETLQVQILVGNQVGAYYFDDFSVDGDSIVFNSAQEWYVSMSGDDTNDGLSPATAFRTFNEVQNHVQPGDTIFVVGTYTNDSYNPNYTYSGNINDPYIWHAENSVRLNNIHGTASQYITIKPFDSSTVIKGDGNNIFRVTNASYLRVEGFEIYGEVENIPLSTALALQFLYREDGSTNTLRRVPEGTTDAEVLALYSEPGSLPILNNISRPSYTDTRGFYFSNVHHIDLINNKIHHTPGNGFRVSNCDYINIIGNEVYATSRKSYSGTHGLVVTNADSQIQGFPDTNDGYKIIISKNKVYENYNEIYSWAPSKTLITPIIDEGKGISLQRNDIDDNDTPGDTSDDTGWLHGRILVANNITYKNGFSGLHSNSGLRIDFINNTSYLNSYTKSVYAPITSGNGGNIGISMQSGDDIKIINNIAVIDLDLNKSAIASANTTGLVVDRNLIYGVTFDSQTSGVIDEDDDIVAVQTNTLMVDPLFVDPANNDFNLQSNSQAISYADVDFAPLDDYFGNLRDGMPDLGALEFYDTNEMTYTYDGSWSPSNPSGISTANDIINVISGVANNASDIINVPTEAKRLNISSGAKLVIDTDASLTVEELDNQGILTIRSNAASFGTFIASTVISNGTVDYRRYVNANASEGGNDLISAPVNGQTFGDFVQNQTNESVIFSNPNNTSQKLFGPFDKSTNTYAIYDTDTSDADVILLAGRGYRAASDPSSNNVMVFTGNLEVGNISVPIENTGTDFAPWNLIGNPYTANIDFATFFEQNEDQLSDDAFRAVYGYNATDNRWTIWNQLTIDNPVFTELIVPGQAFFVSSKPDNGTILFTPEMRRAGATDDFIQNRSTSNSNSFLANLTLETDDKIYDTQVYFIDGKTRGLDLGFDAGAFNGEAEGIFTHLVEYDLDTPEEELDIDMAIQVLALNDLSAVIVPVGVKIDQGTQFSIGLNTLKSNLPENITVYLEDRETNTWTLLNDEVYALTSNTELSGVGRFFLHFQEDTLSQPTTSNQNISLTIDKSKHLSVYGLNEGSYQIEIFSYLGQELISTKLNSSSSTVDLSSLSQGVYIVKLLGNALEHRQKIILK